MRSLALWFFAAVPLAAQGGLPPLPVPPENPITPQKAILGKLLFWEEQMSTNNRVACGTCHTFAAGGGDLRRVVHPGNDGVIPSPDDIFGSPGIARSDANNDYLADPVFRFQPQITGRASPGNLVAAWFPDLFWDGRARTTFFDPDTGAMLIAQNGALENQALGPILSQTEMAHDARTFGQAVQKLSTAQPMALATNLPPDMAAAVAGGVSYPDLFSAAFGTSDITAARIAFALATYQRTLVPDQTPWDQFQGGNPQALTPQQQNGMNVFNGPARCNLCHTPGLFSDRQFRNLGLRPIADDNGRQGVTGLASDAGKFKVPSLRNVGLRASFMHNGQFTTLTQVVGFYIGGGGPNLLNKDPLLVPLNGPPPGGVPPQAANDLVVFLTTALTDPRVAAGQFPFDRPTLAGDRIPVGGVQYGLASPGSGARFPQLLADVPANVGNRDFKLGVHNGVGGAMSVLLIAVNPAATSLGGVNLNVDAGSALFLFSPLGGAAGVAGQGFGTWRLPLPDEPGLAGLTLFAQAWVWDAAVAGGASSTRGAEIRLF
jgi:cytochrome c peroxidase